MTDALKPGMQFRAQRPKKLRNPGRGHPLRYIIGKLEQTLGELVRDLQLGADYTVLDYGCGDGHNRKLFAPGTIYVGADLPGNPAAEVELGPDGTLPCEAGCFDAVLSAQVLEHVTDPALYLRECVRVLKPGGRLLLSTHGMMIYHRDPVDLWRWTNEGLRLEVRRSGLEIVRFRGIMGLAAVGLQLFQFATYSRLPRWFQPPYAMLMQSLVSAFDRLHSEKSRAQEALVFALVAVKPPINSEAADPAPRDDTPTTGR